jgi:DNA-binding transcriptional regulator YhcF (GntR family)
MKKTDPIVYVTVDAGAQEPAYEQIATQIQARISSGALPPGTSLPSVRTLASDLGYNLNTIARAYRLLEDTGFVRIRDRAGVEVAHPAASPSSKERERLGRELAVVIARLRQAGVRLDEIREMVESRDAKLGGGG